MSNSFLYRAALVIAACGAGLFPGAPATAVVLDTSPHAFTGTPNPLGGAWQGEETLSSAFSSADLDWAVFESGDFDLFLADIGSSASNPSVAGEFVYAYQLINMASSLGISALTVGLDGDETISGPTAPDPSWMIEAEYATGPPPLIYPFLGSAQGANPGPTSMAWQWALTASGDTTILYFVSPNLPELDNASLAAGFLPAEVLGVIGSPSNLTVPEPATCFLALSALALVSSVRRFRR